MLPAFGLALLLCAEKSPVELGREIFVAQCIECHNAGGDKPLETGAALSERHLDDGDMRANIAGRLGAKATEERREAVRQYILSFNRYTKKR